MGYEHIEVERRGRVGWLWLSRPDKRNALSADMWEDIPLAVEELATDPDIRALVVAGRGEAFTVGIDIGMLASLSSHAESAGAGRSEAAANAEKYRTIRQLQRTMSVFEDCPKPVIAAIHGYCLGAGIDLITACDMRVAAADAVFGVRETRLAIVADVGTLQRLPRLIPAGHVADLVYTGRDIDATRAERIGLINDVFPDVEALHAGAAQLAGQIAANSPLAVQGSKTVLAAGKDLTTEQALERVALWNSAFLNSDDLGEALAAFTERRPPEFTGT